MKNKKQLYILLPAVLVVWGLIVFKIYDSTSSETISHNVLPTTPEDIIASVEQDTYELILDYNDPFLNAKKTVRRKKARAKRPVSGKVQSKKTNAETSINWNAINYLGFTENSKTSQKTAMVTINKKHYMVKEHQEIEGFVINKISKNLISVNKDGQVNDIARN